MKKAYMHPGYHNIYNDIAVVELEEPLKFSKSVKPIQLPSKEDVLKAGDLVTITGYGVTQREGYKNILQMIEVPIIERAVCNKYYAGEVKEYMICAGLREGGKDACQVSAFKRKLYVVNDFVIERVIPEDHWPTRENCWELSPGAKDVRNTNTLAFILMLFTFCHLLTISLDCCTYKVL